jgi:hypothetical protein
MPPLNEAIRWYQAGYMPLPLKPDGSKAPAVKSWTDYQRERPDLTKVLELFQVDSDGLGLVCGAVSGNFELFELEGRAVEEGYLERLEQAFADRAMVDLFDKIAGGYTEVTPSGGYHFYYRVDGRAHPNTKLAQRIRDGKREPLIETRGEGGFTVIAPSNGRSHESGQSWAVVTGTGPESIPTITEEERDALYAIARTLDELPIAEPPPRPTSSNRAAGSDDLRPGDDFNEKASWAEILEPHGLKIFRHYGGNLSGWQRPGKRHPGLSATTGRNEADRLYVFSTATQFEIEKPYSKFAAYALLNHNGDYAAAAKALRQQGYGGQSAEDHGFSGIWEPNSDQRSKSEPGDAHDNGRKTASEPGEYAAFIEGEIVKEAQKLMIRELARERWAQEKAGETVLPDFIRLDDFLAQESSDEPQLIKGLWNKDTPVLFSAQFKAGKTTVRDNALKCLADGGLFLGRFEVTPVTDSTIVVIDLELSKDMMRDWLRVHGFINQDRVVVVPMRGRAHALNLLVPEVRARWATRLREWNAKVVILDCLRPALDGLGLSEDKDAGRFLNAGFDPLLVEAGGLDGMAIHHKGHTGERARGDSSMLGWGDSWRLLRKSEDPGSPRYFTAYGRDIDVPESELEYDGATRTLTITGGSRKDADKDAAWPIVKAWIKEHPGCSATAVVNAFNKKQTEYEPISERVVRDAIRRALFRGELYDEQTDKGTGRAQKLVVSTVKAWIKEQP